jgi:outer membrane protease
MNYDVGRFYGTKTWVALLFVLAATAHAKDTVRGEWAVSSGFLFGTAHEYVLKDGAVISRLDWDENGAAFIGLDGKLSFGGFFVKTGLLSTIPPQYSVGKMRDYDFLLAGSSEVSHYSSHDVYLDKHFQLGASFGYIFSRHNFEITPSVGYLFKNRKWAAVDGFLQYPQTGAEWTGDEAEEKVSGTVISYEQVFHIPFFAVGIAYKTDLQRIEINGSVFPYMWSNTLDSHFMRAIQFYDKMRGGIGGHFEVAYSLYPASFKTKKIGFRAALNYQFIRDLTGTAASQEIGRTDTAMTETALYTSKMETDIWLICFGLRGYL